MTTTKTQVNINNRLESNSALHLIKQQTQRKPQGNPTGFWRANNHRVPYELESSYFDCYFFSFNIMRKRYNSWVLYTADLGYIVYFSLLLVSLSQGLIHLRLPSKWLMALEFLSSSLSLSAEATGICMGFRWVPRMECRTVLGSTLLSELYPQPRSRVIHNMCIEVREQLMRVGYLFSPCGFPLSKSGI